MALSPKQLRIELGRAGIANAAIDAVWPQWWSSDAESSLSATAELTFTVARRLGLSPQGLLDGEAKFVWRAETKYKHLNAATSREEVAVSSFGCAVARAVIAGTAEALTDTPGAMDIRAAILRDAAVVDAPALLSVAWGLGIPVLQLRIFPLPQKRMHAMSVGIRGRAAILLAREVSYLAPMVFTLAHEIGHVLMGHLAGTDAVVDIEDPLRSPQLNDQEEVEADRFALELLTGHAEPQVVTSADRFSATQLADAVTEEGPRRGIDPGVLAMCAGHSTGQWERAYGALKMIPPQQQNVSGYINGIAERQLNWPAMTSDGRDYVHAVMGLPQDDV